MPSEAISRSMRSNRRSDTKPEIEVRKILRSLGFSGYRLQWKKAPGRPDIAYPGRKVAIFVNGCFWHHHRGCKRATTPSANREFWEKKFSDNRARDERVKAKLEDSGWTVIVIWECELHDSKARVEHFLYETLSDGEEPKFE